jgi:single-stranded-DNA-specific exonuclease
MRVSCDNLGLVDILGGQETLMDIMHWSNLLSLTNKRWRLLHASGPADIFELLVANRRIHDLDTFLAPNFETDLHNPFLMGDMQQAVDLLRQVQREQRKVMIVGDYDADGITGTALLYRTFKKIGLSQVICRLPHRIHDGYGFQPHIVKEAVRDGVEVIVTVDNGVSSDEAITLAKQHGIAVIVCDHHTIPAALPPADAILHPKRENDDYPFSELTGVGVAFKLAQALCPRMLPSKQAESFLKWNLDLVAIGTIADCATVMGENRVLIKWGLLVLEKIFTSHPKRRPGLYQLLQQCLGNNPTYDSALIGFRLAPRINAAGRISHPDASLKLLLTKDAVEAEVLARNLQTLNTKRQQQTLAAVEEAQRQLQADLAHEKILIAKNKHWHPGIVGLIAGRLTEAYHRPSMIFHEQPNGDLVGSARSIEPFNIIDAITRQQSLLSRFGGHSQAAGCSLKPAQYEAFCRNMKALAQETLADVDLYPTVEIDCEVQPEQLTRELKQQLDRLEPYGIGNERPVFLLSKLEVQGLNPVGQGGAHLQLWLRTQGKTLKGIAFQQGAVAGQLRRGDLVNVACYLQENHWNGQVSLELEVVDIQKSDLK